MGRPEPFRRTTGRALLFTSAVLACGFILYTASSLVPLAKFGMLTALAIVLAFVLDILISPALMVLLTRGDLRTETTAAPAAKRAVS